MTTHSDTIKRRYDRLAPYFEGMEAVMEGLFLQRWRQRCWEKVEGHHILEIGVGTGKNFEYYPPNAAITAIDFSPAMLEQAKRKQQRKHTVVDLHLMDAQSLCFASNSFDTVIATFVFCSVPQPLKGLKEIQRVCKPNGQILLLEHVISSKKPIAGFMNTLNPLVLKLVGANINRNTVKTVKGCGFSSVRIDERCGDIIKLIEARK
ncbi:MAG: class I SAM-dependent methyltransferase [Methylococcaceae bacterium]